MAAALAAGFGLGFVVAAQIGPISLLCIRSVLRGRFAVGVAIGAGAAVIDTVYAALGVAGASRLLEVDPLRVALGLIGAAVLALIGLRTLASAFRKYPLHFDALFCNLVAAGEQAGILESLLDRLASYKEKILAIKSKIKAALFYPIAIIAVAFIITAVIMIFVIPAFKQVFTSFGADLPAPTLFVMAVSDAFVQYWYIIFGVVGGGIYGFFAAWKRSLAVQIFMDRLMLKVPVFGDLVRKSSIARWTRTLSTMFAAGVPLVEALDSVGGAAGNYVYAMATKQIQGEVSSGTALTAAMQNTNVFPNMVLQMVSIGEETGALDGMLGKVADFYEQEVDDAVEALSSLMEPMIMVVLGTLIGGMVIAMYLPIFKIGQAV